MLIIEVGIDPECENRMIESARKYAIPVLKVRRKPFSEEWLNDVYDLLPSNYLDISEAWFYGDIMSCKVAKRTTKWRVDADWEALSFSSVLKYGKDDVLNFDAEFVTIKHLEENKDNYILSDHFVKPNAADKLFSGQLVSKLSYNKDISLLNAYDPPKDTVVAISSAKKVIQENRYAVINNQIISGSVYNVNGKHNKYEPTEEENVIAEKLFVSLLNNGFVSNDNWTFDICKTSENKWKILEVGALSCSGLYLCNTDKIIKAIFGI